MAARWEDRQDGRNAGRADASTSTPPTSGGIGCSLEVVSGLLFVLLYVTVHALVWLGRVVIP